VRGGLAVQECRGGRRCLLEVTDSASEEVVSPVSCRYGSPASMAAAGVPATSAPSCTCFHVVQKAEHLLPRCAEGWHQGMHMQRARVKLNPFFTCLESERMAASSVYFQSISIPI
jgi:hypothetical protein